MSSDHPKVSLRALEVFEAAVRLKGFTVAGAELGITQSAVSRQIADLEGILGVKLFYRRGAHVDVTPSASRLAARLTSAFGEVRTAVSDTVRSDSIVTLSMLPSVAAKWFAPRLGRFVAAHAGIDLRITASRHLVDFAAEGIDAAIRYGRGPWPGLDARVLATETVTPVCTPSYAADHGLTDPSHLERSTLLHGDIPETWAAWFAAAGCEVDARAGPRLGDDAAILQAVLNDQGVALGRSHLVADDLETGKLIQPFETHLPASHMYWFVRPQIAAERDALRAVGAWVKREFAADGL